MRQLSAPPRSGTTPLTAAAGISAAGDGAIFIAAPLLATLLTRSALAVSTITAAGCVTWLLAGLPAGALVDRAVSLRRLLVLANLARMAALAAAAAVVATGYASVPLLIAAVIADTLGACVCNPASEAMIPALAGDDEDTLRSVNGRYWASYRAGSSLAGPPLASALLSAARFAPFAADAVSFAASAVLIRTLPAPPRDAPPPAGSLIAMTASGLRYTAGAPGLPRLIAGLAVTNAAYVMALAPFALYAREILHLRSAFYGLLFVPGAIAGIAASWRAGPLLRGLSARQVLTAGAGTQAAMWLLIAASGTTWAAVVGITAVDTGAALVTIPLAAAFQRVDAGMRGRVNAAYSVLCWGTGGAAALIGGALADALGLSAGIAIAAALSALAMLIAWPRRVSRSA